MSSLSGHIYSIDEVPHSVFQRKSPDSLLSTAGPGPAKGGPPHPGGPMPGGPMPGGHMSGHMPGPPMMMGPHGPMPPMMGESECMKCNIRRCPLILLVPFLGQFG